MKASSLLVTLALLVSSAHAQNWSQTRTQVDLETWIASQFQGKQRVGLPAVLNAAKAKGWLQTASDRKLIKRQFRAIARTRPGSGHSINLGVIGKMSHDHLPLAAQDLEYNDSTAYANDFGPVAPGVNSVSGNVLAGEIDSFRFEVLADATVVFSAAVNGPLPMMEITNAAGSDMWDMGFFSTPSATVNFPKGVYDVRLHGTAGAASYVLDLNVNSAPMPVLTPGQSISSALPATGLVGHRVVLPADGRLDVQSNAGGQDTILYLVNEDFCYVYTVEDDSRSASQLDAGLNALLPQGTYYLYFYSGNGNALSTVITTAFTAMTIPPLGGTTLTGVIAGGEEDFDTYTLLASQPEAITVTGAPSSAAPTSDAYFMLHDRRMTVAQDLDDSGLGNSLFPAGTVTMPAGLYYVSSSGMYDLGGYSVSRSSGPAVTTAALPGLNRGNLALSDVALTYTFSVQNDTPCEVDVVELGMSDAEVFVIDAKTGLSLGWSDTPFGDASCNFGPVLPKGDYYVIVKDWDGGPGTFDMLLNTPLHRRAADRVFAVGTQGNPIVLLAGFGQTPGINPLPNILVGDVFVDLNGSFTASVPMAANGVLDWGFSLPPGSGIFLQHLEIDVSLGKGFFSNLLK